MNKLKILIPTDFSVQAEFAYLIVKRIGDKLPVDVHFLHVLNVPDTVTMNERGEIDTCGEIDVSYVEQQKQIALRGLQSLKSQYGEDINTHLVLGKTTDKIVNVAATGGFDLIVTGTKGAWGLKEKLSGSESQMIVRRSTVPVLSLMCDRSNLEINNVLLVHNFKESNNQQLDLLHKIVGAFGAKVHFLQVAGTKDDQAAIRADMAKFAKENGIGQYEPHIVMDQDVESGVVHFNQMSNMDIICIGTHGQGGWFHTSATEKLVNHMFKPIISFHLKSK